MRTAPALACLLALGLGWPAAASAGPPGAPTSKPTASTGPDELSFPPTQNRRPPGHVRTARQVLALAAEAPKIRRMRQRHPGARPTAYLKGTTRWQVSYFLAQRGDEQRREIAQVLIDDRSGTVQEAWTGFQVAWTMARGYEGAFGRKATALYVWLALLVMFVAPFVDRRRWRSLRNLDLAVLASFSVSLAFFSHGNIGLSVPLAYPPLLYLLARMLLLARARAREHPKRAPRPFRLAVPATWLVVGLVFLVGFRVGLNVVNSNVIDVGYAGVIGAERISQGERIYGNFPEDNEHGDTYGPVVYLAYVPWEAIWPWDGGWDDLPAAHGAAVFFDLLTLALLFGLGWHLGGRTLGLAVAYAWAAYPFTLFASSSNTNDSLVAALVVAALLVAGSPAARGVLGALAGLTKFSPLLLVGLLALYQLGDGWRTRARRLATFAVAFAVMAAAVLLPFVGGLDGLDRFWNRTLGYQATRGSPFSVWGFLGALDGWQRAVQAGAVLLAGVVAFVPRRRDLATLSALAAAVLIAVQLGVTHWFYLYIPWFFGLVLAALLAEGVAPPWRGGDASGDSADAATPADSRPPAPALSHRPASAAMP